MPKTAPFWEKPAPFYDHFSATETAPTGKFRPLTADISKSPIGPLPGTLAKPVSCLGTRPFNGSGKSELLTLLHLYDIVLLMKHTWETCTLQATQARWSGFHVTMNPAGMIYLNGSAMKALDNAERFELLYDQFNNTIGLKPTNSLNKFASKAAIKGKHGGRKIRAFRLLKQFQIKLDGPVRFLKPEVNDEGIMILDLRQTSVAIRKRSN